MKRRHFITTALAALAGVAVRRPKPEPITLPANPVPPGWEVIGYTYLFGRDAGVRCYGRTPIFARDYWGSYGSVTGVGEQELIGVPANFTLISNPAAELPRIVES